MMPFVGSYGAVTKIVSALILFMYMQVPDSMLLQITGLKNCAIN